MKPEDDPFSPRTWLSRARSNLNLAEGGRYIQGVFLEDLCFDAQQAAEKALKAACIYYKIDFPKTHSLTSLINLIEANGIEIPEEVHIAATFTQYAVRTRYPEWIEPITQ